MFFAEDFFSTDYYASDYWKVLGTPVGVSGTVELAGTLTATYIDGEPQRARGASRGFFSLLAHNTNRHRR